MPKRNLTVSLDGLRRGLAWNYNELVDILQKNTYDGGEITLHADDVQAVIDKLRGSVAALHCIYMDDVDKFSDLSDEVDNLTEFNAMPEDQDNTDPY